MALINLQDFGDGDVVLSNDSTPITKSPQISDGFNLSDVKDRIENKTPISTPKKGADMLSIFDIPELKVETITPSRKGIQAMDYDVPFESIYDRRWDGSYSTKFDNYMGATGNEDRLAKENSFIGNLGRGAYRFGAKTINYALDATLGTVGGILTSISKGSIKGFWDNDISNWLDHANEELDYKVGQLYTDEYKSNNILENIFSGNFLDFATGDLLDGLAFVAGAVLPELAITYFTGGTLLPETISGLGARIGSSLGKDVAKQGAKTTLKVASRGFAKNVVKDAEREVGLDLIRTKWWSGVGKNVGEAVKTSGFIARTSGFEAGMEARGAFHDAIYKFHNEFADKNGREPTKDEVINFYKDAKSSANGVFGANMAILSISNLAMFGASFGVANKFRAGVSNVGKKFLGLAPEVSATGKLVLPELSSGRKVFGSVHNTLGTAVVEANEEGLQNTIHNTMNNYLEAKYDPRKDSSYGFSSALTEGFSEAYGSNQGTKEIGMGFIIGLIAPFLQSEVLGLPGHETFKKKRADVEAAVKASNNSYDKYSTIITRQLNNSNVAKVFSESMLSGNEKAQQEGKTPPIQDLNTAILHKQFLDSQLPLKSRGQIEKEYNSIVDNIQFDDSVKEQVGSVEDYKELLKNDFKRNSENHKVATSLVNNLGLYNKVNLDKTKGNTVEIGDQLVVLMMQGEAAKYSKRNLGNLIDNITGNTGSMSAVDFFSGLTTENKNKVITLNNRRRDLKEAKRRFVEHSRLLNGLSSNLNRNFTNKTLENRKNKIAERHEILRLKVESLTDEVSSLSESLKSLSNIGDNLSSTDLGDINNIPITDDILSKLDKLDTLDNYIEVLNKSDNKSDANYLKYLVSQYKSMNDTHRELNETFNLMSKSGFFRSKKGKGFVDSMLGPTYVMSEDFINKIRERREGIDEAFAKVGIRGIEKVEEAIKEQLSDDNLSDREKFKLENIFRIILGGQDRFEKAREAFQKNNERYSEESTEDEVPLRGDTITSLVREVATEEGITDIERIQKVIDVMLDEVDSIRGKTRKEQLEALIDKFRNLSSGDVDSKIEAVDREIKEIDDKNTSINSEFKTNLEELEKNTEQAKRDALKNENTTIKEESSQQQTETSNQSELDKINKKRQDELDKNSGKSKLLNTPTQNKQEALNKGEKILQDNKELVKQLEKEFSNEDETLFNQLDEKLETLLSQETQGEISYRFDNGKIVLTIDEVKKGNIINSNYKGVREGQIGEFEIGDNIQVNNGSVAMPGIVTKISPTGRVVEAQSKNGIIIIRNGVVLSSNTIQRDKEINTKYDAEIAKLKAKYQAQRDALNKPTENKSELDKINKAEKDELEENKINNKSEDNSHEDVTALRNAKTKTEIDNAIIKATQSDNIQDALNAAENIIGKPMHKAIYYSDPSRFANDLAKEIETITSKEKSPNKDVKEQEIAAKYGLSDDDLSTRKEELIATKEGRLEEQSSRLTELNAEKYDLENSDKKKELDEITKDGSIQEEIDKLNEEIDNLENPKIFRKGEYSRFEELTKKKFAKELTDEEQDELVGLGDDLDQWIAITGMSVEGYRLSDLIELRIQLENTPIKNVENVVQPEKSKIVGNIFKLGQNRANYDFGQSQNVVTITGLTKNKREYISIQGISLEDLNSKLPSDFNLETSTKEFKDEASRNNIVLSKEEVDRINTTQESDILINPPIDSSDSNYGLLLIRVNGDTFGPLKSTIVNDSNSPMQTEQIYNSNVGDTVKLRVDTQDTYNKGLLDNLRNANTDKQKEKAKKALRESLTVEVWLGNYKIATLKAKNARIKTWYDVRFEAMRGELIDNEDSINELLTRDVFEQGNENFPINGDVTIKGIKLGQPNVIVTKNDNGEVSIVSREFSSNDTKKVADIGYIEGDKYFTKSGRTEFEKSYVSNLENTAGRTPFIIVKMGEKFIAYPVELKVESKPDNSSFKEIYNSDTSNINKILELNKFMAEIGVDIKKDGNHFNQVNINDEDFFNTKLAQSDNIKYFYNLEDWVSSNRSIDEILMNEAMTDLNLSEPFVSPKIAMNFSEVNFNENSYKINQDSITLASEGVAEYTTSDVLDKKIENTCKS